MKKIKKCSSGTKMANHRMIDDIARRKNEKQIIAKAIKRVTAQLAPDQEDWL